MFKSTKNPEQNMGRRPIHDQAMSDAERQRRRRAKVRAEPWRDQRKAMRAILEALRELQNDADGRPGVDGALMAKIIETAVARLAPEDADKREDAHEMVSKLLDPNVPLPERGHRRRRDGRGRRSDNHQNGRRGRRHAEREQSPEESDRKD